MTVITPSTPWRETGGTTVAGLIAEFRTRPTSPLIDEAARLLAVTGDLSRLLGAISLVEQQHATAPSVARNATNHNFLSLASGWDDAIDGHTWFAYPSFAACALAWRAKLLNPTGPYAAARTVADLIEVYAPRSENDTDHYIAVACQIINRMPLVATEPETTMPTDTITFGRVTAPPVEHHDLDPSLNTAWDDLGQRRGLFVVLHSTYGDDGWAGLMGTESYFRGDARERARTDYGVDNRGGRIVRWTDPLSRQSGYASGPYKNPSGDARALVAKVDVIGINRDGISIETAGRGDDPVSEVAFERLAQLVAFWADYNEIPWNVWPINPKTGVTFVYWHGEFNGEKRDTCPNAAVRERTTPLIARVKDILKDAQSIAGIRTGNAPPPAPPNLTASTMPTTPATAPTALAMPEGVDVAMLREWFGAATVFNGDKAMTFSYDPAGPLSRLWLARGRKTGVWPTLELVTPIEGGRFFTFSGGWRVRALSTGKVEEVT